MLGEVVTVHIDRAFVSEGVYDTAAARPVLRAGGAGWYSEIIEDAMFDLRRPSSSDATLEESAELPIWPFAHYKKVTRLRPVLPGF